MKFKAILSLILCLILTAGLCACNTDKRNNKIRIAVIAKSEDSDFWHAVKKGVDTAATEYNVDVTFEGPQNEEDYITQNSMIERAAKDGADAIVLSAINYYQSAESVNKAARLGSKIVTIDSDVDSSNVSLFIGTDNIEAGRAAGKAATEGFSQNSEIYIGLVNYYESSDNGIQREKGFREYISNIPNAQIVAGINVDSNTQSAEEGSISLLNDYPQINVLVGFNEWMTLGVGNAINKLSLSDKVLGVGFDTNIVSVGMIETGEMDALIVQNPFAMGYLGVMNAAKLAAGEAVDEGSVYTKVTTVNRENLFDEDIQKILFRFG